MGNLENGNRLKPIYLCTYVRINKLLEIDQLSILLHLVQNVFHLNLIVVLTTWSQFIISLSSPLFTLYYPSSTISETSYPHPPLIYSYCKAIIQFKYFSFKITIIWTNFLTISPNRMLPLNLNAARVSQSIFRWQIYNC